MHYRDRPTNVPTRDEARDRSWFSLENPLGALDNPRTYHNIGFDAGARWAIYAGSELSPYVSRFIEMLILVGIAPEWENGIEPSATGITTPEQPPVPSENLTKNQRRGFIS